MYPYAQNNLAPATCSATEDLSSRTGKGRGNITFPWDIFQYLAIPVFQVSSLESIESENYKIYFALMVFLATPVRLGISNVHKIFGISKNSEKSGYARGLVITLKSKVIRWSANEVCIMTMEFHKDCSILLA